MFHLVSAKLRACEKSCTFVYLAKKEKSVYRSTAMDAWEWGRGVVIPTALGKNWKKTPKLTAK